MAGFARSPWALPRRSAATYSPPSATIPVTTVGSGCHAVQSKPSGPRGGGPAGPGPTCAILLPAREQEVGAEVRHERQDDDHGDRGRADEQRGQERAAVAAAHERGDHGSKL